MNIEKLKLRVQNVLPTTKWPLTIHLYGVHDESKIHDAGMDRLRPYTRANGDYVYVMKSTGEFILPPPAGVEDKKGVLKLLIVGDGEYRYITQKTNWKLKTKEDGSLDGKALVPIGLTLDSAGIELVASIRDDEQMKILYAKACEDQAKRFQAETPWFKTAIVAIIVVAISCAAFIYLTGGSVRELDSSLANLAGVVQNLDATITNVGSLPGAAKPPV